jgi:hypothetical protein
MNATEKPASRMPLDTFVVRNRIVAWD